MVKLMVTAAIAKAFAEIEFEKFRVLQDRTYQSDFDRVLLEPGANGGVELVAEEGAEEE